MTARTISKIGQSVDELGDVRRDDVVLYLDISPRETATREPIRSVRDVAIRFTLLTFRVKDWTIRFPCRLFPSSLHYRRK